MFERSYERLEHVRGRCRGHRHDENINVGLLLEVLEIMEDVMDASVAFNQVAKDVKTLLTDVSTKIGELVDAVNAGNSVTAADLEAVDQSVKDGITSVEGTQVPGAGGGTPAGGGTGGTPSEEENPPAGGTSGEGTTTGGAPGEGGTAGGGGSGTVPDETAPGSGVSGAAGPVQGEEGATPGNAAQ